MWRHRSGAAHLHHRPGRRMRRAHILAAFGLFPSHPPAMGAAAFRSFLTRTLVYWQWQRQPAALAQDQTSFRHLQGQGVGFGCASVSVGMRVSAREDNHPFLTSPWFLIFQPLPLDRNTAVSFGLRGRWFGHKEEFSVGGGKAGHAR